MDKIILASNNKHKISEFKQMFADCEIVLMADIGFNQDIEETGTTFLENSLIKARAISAFLKEKGIEASVMADDSGLCVDALDGAPGVYSARYAGEHGNDEANRQKLLKELEDKKDRTAHFVCNIVEVYPDGHYIHAEGRTSGHILFETRGKMDFAFDPLFYSDELKKSFGEATAEEKNSVSHRGRAIEKIKILRKQK